MTLDLETLTWCGLDSDYADNYTAAIDAALAALPRPSRQNRRPENAAALRLWNQLDSARSAVRSVRGLLNAGEALLYRSADLTLILSGAEQSQTWIHRARRDQILSAARVALSVTDSVCLTVCVSEEGFWFRGDEELTAWS